MINLQENVTVSFNVQVYQLHFLTNLRGNQWVEWSQPRNINKKGDAVWKARICGYKLEICKVQPFDFLKFWICWRKTSLFCNQLRKLDLYLQRLVAKQDMPAEW